MSSLLHTTIRTPHQALFEGDLQGLRVPTETGQVGVRPGAEPLILVVEAGLVLLHAPGQTLYAATSGGLLRTTRTQCDIYTPFAAVGTQEAALLAELDRALTAPDSELLARRQLNELEQRIVREIGHRAPAVPRSFR